MSSLVPPTVTPAGPTSRTPRVAIFALCLALVAALLGVGLSGATQYAAPGTADAKAPKYVKVAHGIGHEVGGVWLGTWKTPKGPGFCIDFDKAHPTTSGEHKLTGNVPGMSSTESKKVIYIANRYGPSKNTNETMAAAIFVWKTQNTDRFDRYYARMLAEHKISTTVRALVARMTKEASTFGPYSIKVDLAKGYVGQSVPAKITVSANGHRVPGVKLTLSTNAYGSITSSSRTTNSKGELAVTTKVNQVAKFQLNAKLVVPAATGAWINSPKAGTQRTVIASTTKQSTQAYDTLTPPSPYTPKVTSTCSSTCSGSAPVMVKADNPKGAATLREYVYANGVEIGHVDIKGGAHGTFTKSLPDSTAVTTAYCYLNSKGSCTGPRKVHGGKLVVDCPPAPEFKVTVYCPCGSTDKTLTYSVRLPVVSTRTYTASVVRNGGTAQSVTVSGTGWVDLPTVAFAKGDSIQLSFSVQGKTKTLDEMTRTV